MSDWISVDERLPNDGAIVLVYLSDYEAQVAAMIYSKQWTAFSDHLDAGPQNIIFDDFNSEAITHWMPLPPPPETDKCT
jgi:hypothetical protein